VWESSRFEKEKSFVRGVLGSARLSREDRDLKKPVFVDAGLKGGQGKGMIDSGLLVGWGVSSQEEGPEIVKSGYWKGLVQQKFTPLSFENEKPCDLVKLKRSLRGRAKLNR